MFSREFVFKKIGGSGKDEEIFVELLVYELVNKKFRFDINEVLGEGVGNEDSDFGSDELDFEILSVVIVVKLS